MNVRHRWIRAKPCRKLAQRCVKWSSPGDAQKGVPVAFRMASDRLTPLLRCKELLHPQLWTRMKVCTTGPSMDSAAPFKRRSSSISQISEVNLKHVSRPMWSLNTNSQGAIPLMQHDACVTKSSQKRSDRSGFQQQSLTRKGA